MNLTVKPKISGGAKHITVKPMTSLPLQKYLLKNAVRKIKFAVRFEILFYFILFYGSCGNRTLGHGI